MFSERERGSESEPSSELAVPAEAEAVAAAAEQLPMEVLVGSEPSKPLEPSKSCEPGAEEEDVDVVHESDHEEYSYRDSDNDSDIDDAPPLANFSEAAQILLAERASLEEFREGLFQGCCGQTSPWNQSHFNGRRQTRKKRYPGQHVTKVPSERAHRMT